MNKESLENLSALMDGDISRETGMFLTRRMGSDEELCRSWERYHLIRDCMQRPGGQLADSEMCRKLRERLANEQAAAGQRKRSMPAWLKPVSGLAVAASVALVAIITVVPAPSPDGQPGANSAGLERLGQGVEVHDVAASGVDQDRALLHRADEFRADQPLRLGCAGHVQRDDIGTAQQSV